jgi:hypothetical protein
MKNHRVDPAGIPCVIITMYQNAGYSVAQIADFDVKANEDETLFIIKSPKRVTIFKQAGNLWHKFVPSEYKIGPKEK